MTEATSTEAPANPEADGARVERFLADSAVVAAFRRVEEECFAAFRRAQKMEDLQALHAKVRAIGELRDELVAVVGNGHVARHQREQAEKKAVALAGKRPR